MVRRGAIAALEREWPARPDVGQALIEIVTDDCRGSARQAAGGLNQPPLAAAQQLQAANRVNQAALAALQRSWPPEHWILDAIANRVKEGAAYTYAKCLVEYLAKHWRGNIDALELVIRIAVAKQRACTDDHSNDIRADATRAIAEG
jgi:hypothetical protein